MSEGSSSEREIVAASSMTINAAVCKQGGAHQDALLTFQACTSEMETQLGCVPVVLTVTNKLAVIAASGRDFSLIPKDSRGQQREVFRFQHLKDPTSYRACLAQVANEQCAALRTAHGSMAFIGMSMIRVPGLMEVVLETLARGTHEEVSLFLPVQFKAIMEIAEAGKSKVKKVIQEFNTAICTIQEVSQACLVARGDSEAAKSQTELLRKLAIKKKIAFKKELDKVTADCKTTEKIYKKEQEDFKKALDHSGSFKDGMAHVGLAFGDTLFNVAAPSLAMSGSISLMAHNMTGPETGYAVAGLLGSKVISEFAQKRSSTSPSSSNATSKEEEKLRSQMQSSVDSEFQLCAENLKENVCSVMEAIFKDQDGFKMLDLVKMQNENKVDEARLALRDVGRQIKELQQQKGATPEMTGQMLGLYQSINSLIQEIVSLSEREASEAKEHQELFNILEKLQFKCVELGQARSAAATNPTFKEQRSGMAAKTKEMLAGTKSRLSETYIRDKFTALEMRREQMRSTQQMKEEKRERVLQQQQKLAEALHDIIKFKQSEATQKDTLNIISKGLTALYELRGRWLELLLYFEKVYNGMKTALGPAMSSFVTYSEFAARSMGGGGEAWRMSDLTRSILFRHAMESVRTAQVIHFMASSYEQVSVKHLLPLTNDFGRIISMDGLLDKERIAAESRVLDDKAKEVQKDIKDIIAACHEKFEKDLERRKEEVEKVFDKYLPALTAPQAERIQMEAKEAVRSARSQIMVEEIDDDYLDYM